MLYNGYMMPEMGFHNFVNCFILTDSSTDPSLRESTESQNSGDETIWADNDLYQRTSTFLKDPAFKVKKTAKEYICCQKFVMLGAHLHLDALSKVSTKTKMQNMNRMTLM
jgi:hypothetical protein